MHPTFIRCLSYIILNYKTKLSIYYMDRFGSTRSFTLKFLACSYIDSQEDLKKMKIIIFVKNSVQLQLC